MARTRLLDLTRSLRRAGRMTTGVDRVEQAYLVRFLSDDVPFFALVRTAFGYALLDRVGARGLADRIAGAAQWGVADLLSRLPRGRAAAVSRAESDARRLSCARATPWRLAAMLRRHLPAEYDYFNVGHSNLTDRVLGAIPATGGTVAVLVHDIIPLEYPQFQRPETVAPFEKKMRRVSARADLIIYNSSETQSRAEALMRAWGRVPTAIVAHLGTIRPAPDPELLPPGLPPSVPYFITVGTIEPRKNHAFLLDLWRDLDPDAPPLLICGSRGWNNAAVFARLDALPPGGPVCELPGLPDAALAALVQHAAGMLFPSHAEGYGLPPLEAAMLGTRVLCNDLSVLREVVQKKAVYAPVSDRYLWLDTIRTWAITPPNAQECDGFAAPDWDDHFKAVLRSG